MPQIKKDKLIAFNKNNILEAAEKLFSEKGVKETTMDDIAKAADYSKSTLYVYFKSKEEIYSFIVYGHMQRLRETIESSISQSADFEQCYYRICEVFAQTYEQYPLYFESLLGPISIAEQNDVCQLIYDEGERINDSLLALFEKGIDEGVLRQDLVILPAVFTLWASLANTILIANQKEAYIAQRMQMSKAEFLAYSFQFLLTALKRGES